jgi:NAD(P)-dependent dehydrogenase (short-subunit alcohol dehydrogenase family)
MIDMAKERLPLAQSMTFIDKKVIVTGAASGIGKAIAVRFAEAGASVLLVDVNPAGLSEAVGCLETASCQHSIFEIDLADKKQIDQFWSSLDGEIPPDILVNNAGVYPMEDYLDVDEAFLETVLDVNMNSTFWMCQNFIRRRKETGGIIVNIASVEAVLPFKKDMAHYGMSKAGVIALMRSLARDFGKSGFRVNVVLPGAIRTSGTKSLMKDAILNVKLDLVKTGYDFQQRLAMGRWGEPDEVAKVVLFLSSDLASYVQGALVPVDGGFLSS